MDKLESDHGIIGKLGTFPVDLPLKESERIIYFLDDATSEEDELSNQLQLFGYTIEKITAFQGIEEALLPDTEQILIINASILSEIENRKKLTELKKHFSTVLRIFFISQHGDFDLRLASVRAGGDAFFHIPTDVDLIVDRIESYAKRLMSEPYHILIVDDEPEQIAYHALILQQAGMITSVASNPQQVLKILVEAKPELILMDMYMPGCSGTELLTIIRQQQAFITIPIIFLSVEERLNRQIEAIWQGGDDFLAKPVKPEHLVKVISTRVERTRSLRYFIERDSLTGLLNHSNLKEQLNREIKRAERTGSTLCFAMLDLDFFKKVNDTYGHLIGDRVLKSLSHLLRERLRRSDIIGRYGGEEFAVILFNTNIEDARIVMEGLRDNFSQILQRSGDTQFKVTFSCGIAQFPDFSSAEELTAAADEVLYRAKDSGRNRVNVMVK
jgi:diguanylate cyclase (GGDEF)-like protein